MIIINNNKFNGSNGGGIKYYIILKLGKSMPSTLSVVVFKLFSVCNVYVLFECRVGRREVASPFLYRTNSAITNTTFMF